MENKNTKSFEEFVITEYPKLSKLSNVHFPIDNIITGLLKNMLRKNISNGREGFIEYNKYFYKVTLDTSGFGKEAIMLALKGLFDNAQAFYKDGVLFSNQIENINYNLEDELASFHLEKDKLIFLRDSIFKSKY